MQTYTEGGKGDTWSTPVQKPWRHRNGQVAIFTVNITGPHYTKSILSFSIHCLETDFTKSSREMLRRTPTTISLTQDDITRYDEARKQKLEAQHVAQQSGSSLENVDTGSRGLNGPAEKQKVRTAEQRIMSRWKVSHGFEYMSSPRQFLSKIVLPEQILVKG